MRYPLNLLLDLGGVLIDLEYKQTHEAFRQLGIKDFANIFSKASQSELFDRFEKGLITATDFAEEVRRLSGVKLAPAEIFRAWNAMLLEIPAERIRFVRSLSEKYNLYLLSNTNVIHLDLLKEQWKGLPGGNVFEENFRYCYFSCELGMRKPDETIFNHVLQTAQIYPDETMFIDDSPQHIAAAKGKGIQATWLNVDGGERLEKEFRWLLNK